MPLSTTPAGQRTWAARVKSPAGMTMVSWAAARLQAACRSLDDPEAA
ncbi:MAG: hypothetical protein IPJ65_42245 [Archangiaceae bacterium]|nr:hypothetical protein [Archangiaceae bacterium]